MGIRPIAILVLSLLLFACTEKQLPQEMPNLLGEWIGESIDEVFSECDEKLGPRTLYTARKLVIESSNIREIVDVISVGSYDRNKARFKKIELENTQFAAPVGDELQDGFHVAVFEFDSEHKALVPPNFDIETSGMDHRRRIVSLTKKQLILEKANKANHLDSACANKIIEHSVYRRH